MQSLKVHDKLSKAQRLMKGRRFRVLKEIEQEVNNSLFPKIFRIVIHLAWTK
jgi:hypothetical protein